MLSPIRHSTNLLYYQSKCQPKVSHIVLIYIFDPNEASSKICYSGRRVYWQTYQIVSAVCGAKFRGLVGLAHRNLVALGRQRSNRLGLCSRNHLFGTFRFAHFSHFVYSVLLVYEAII